MNVFRLCASFIASVALFVAGADASAQTTAAQQSAIRSSCRNDFMTVCSGVQPGGSAALQCLQSNAAKVSPGCQQALAATGGNGGGTAAPSSAGAAGGGASSTAPMQSPQTMPPQGMERPPMMQPQGMQGGGMQGGGMQGGGMQGGGMGGQMSMRDEFRLSREACGPDYRTYCQGVQPGSGRAMMCLEANAQSLSPGCQQALTEMKQRMAR